MSTTIQGERERLERLLADEYLADLVYDALLERGEPAKISEITLEINNPRIAYPAVRQILMDSSRFLLIDRQWDLAARYLDRARPTERNLIEAIEAAGKPLSVAQIATELSAIYERDSSAYFQLIHKVTRNGHTYFRTDANEFGLVTWLPLVDVEEVEDILFDNRLSREALEPYLEASAGVGWSASRYADATLALVEASQGVISHRLLGVLAWFTLREKYDPVKHLFACWKDPRLVWLSGRGGGRWITRAYADRLELGIEEWSRTLATEDEEAIVIPEPLVTLADAESQAPLPTVSPAADGEIPASEEKAPLEPVAEVDTVKPLAVNEEDLAALAQILSDRGTAVEVVDLLALQYEVVPGDPSFRSDLEALEERLRSDERFLYVGAGRFREPNSLPLFVYSFPEFLTFPNLQFVSMDGEIMDEEIEDEGFVGTLRSEMTNPLAQDAGDDEGAYTGEESPETQDLRLALKAHHKEIGTFPLCQVPDGFFPEDAEVVEVSLRAPDGQVHDIIVNHSLRLAFNFFGLYEYLNADSGAVFRLHPTARPYEFIFEPTGETEPLLFIDSERMAELLGLREQVEESGDIPTFDIVCEVLAHYARGAEFVQALAEVNVVRRTTRRKMASILSNYHCFVQKPGQSLWRFDPKKRELGTDRAKKKYIKR